MAYNLLLWAGLPPSEALGKCGKMEIVEHLFGGSVPITLYLEGQTETPPAKMNTVTYTSTMYRGVTQKGMTEFSAGSFYAEELRGAEGYARGGEVFEIEPKQTLKLVVIEGDFDIDEIWDNATEEMIDQYDGAICGFKSGQIVLFGTMTAAGEFVKAAAEDCLKEFAATYRRRDY